MMSWKNKQGIKGHNRCERADLAAPESRIRRFAVVSDIHGNLPALNAVLEDAKSRGISGFIFAGDYCLSGPFPDECIAMLMMLDHTHIVRGNEEKYLENLIGKDQSDWTDGQMQVTYWCFRNVSAEHLRFLTALPHTIEFRVNGVKIHLSHASCRMCLNVPSQMKKQMIQYLCHDSSGGFDQESGGWENEICKQDGNKTGNPDRRDECPGWTCAGRRADGHALS